MRIHFIYHDQNFDQFQFERLVTNVNDNDK